MNALDFWAGRAPDQFLESWGGFSKNLDQIMRGLNQFETARGVIEANCDIGENENNFILCFDIPGVKREDIDIEVDNQTLIVSGERKNELKKDENGLHRSERRFGRFERRFKLPEGIDLDRIEAQYESGVLHLALPKSEVKRSKKVKVSTGNRGFLRKIKEDVEKKEESAAVNE